jgi:hypothetical protein
MDLWNSALKWEAGLTKVARAVEATSVPSSTHSPDPTSSDLSGKMPICPDEQQK